LRHRLSGRNGLKNQAVVLFLQAGHGALSRHSVPVGYAQPLKSGTTERRLEWNVREVNAQSWRGPGTMSRHF
jgi:hypothetical protein